MNLARRSAISVRPSGHRPDRRCSLDRVDLAGLLESERAVEDPGVGEGRLQVTRNGVVIGPRQNGGKNCPTESTPLLMRIDTDEREVPVRLGRVARAERCEACV